MGLGSGDGCTRLMTLQLGPASAAPAKARPDARGGRLSARTLALTTRQLAALIAATPLEESLRLLAAQAERPSERRILSGVHAGVLEGRRLADAMATTSTPRPAGGNRPMAAVPCDARVWPSLEVAYS